MHITCTCLARDVAVTIEAQPLMQTVFRSARPLSYWRAQLRSAVQLPSRQPVLFKPVCALARSQTRPIPRSSHFGLPSSLRCAHASAFGSILRAVSVDHMHTNRLASEESPYLLQHQHNPVRSAGLQLHQSAAILLMLANARIQYMVVLFCRLIGTHGAKKLSKRLWQRTNPFFFLWVTLHAIGRTDHLCIYA